MTVEPGKYPAFNVQLDMGDRTLASRSQTALLSEQLQSAGASAEPGAPIPRARFSVPGQNLTVNEGKPQVFEYPSVAEAVQHTDTVAWDASSIGPTAMFWGTAPHFYRKDTLVALYIGYNASLLKMFEESLGPQFAGGMADGLVTSNQTPDGEKNPAITPQSAW